MIGQERKERLLKHLKEATEFAHATLKPQPIPTCADGPYCCPITVFLGEHLSIFPWGDVYRLADTLLWKGKRIYEKSDSKWWDSLTPQTRKSVLEWINERIEQGLLK